MEMSGRDDGFEDVLQLISDSESDEEEKKCGSRPGRSANIESERREGAEILFKDHFSS